MPPLCTYALPHALQYATFGLGDSSYPKFNFAAKRLYRLVGSGAKPTKLLYYISKIAYYLVKYVVRLAG